MSVVLFFEFLNKSFVMIKELVKLIIFVKKRRRNEEQYKDQFYTTIQASSSGWWVSGYVRICKSVGLYGLSSSSNISY